MIISSDLKRAFQTAQTIATPLSIPVEMTPELREAHIGQAQGLTRHEIVNRFGASLTDQWRSVHPSHLHARYPDGESGQEVIDRVFGFLNQTLLTRPETRIGLCTHGGVIRRIMQALLPSLKQAVPIPNGIVYLIEYHPKDRRWNVAHYFEIVQPKSLP